MMTTVLPTASIPSLSDCDPGIRPVEFNVLILPEAIQEKTKGGIILPDSTKDADRQASQRGRLIAVSPAAFDFAEAFTDSHVKPKPGDLVYFAKYAGVEVEGRDGKKFRICKDRDIAAVIQEDAA